MTKGNLEKYTVASIQDILASLGIPSAILGQVYQDVLNKRNQEALEILFSEIRQGNFSNIDKNEIVSVIARYQRDAMEGVAKNNLHLMARLIKGMAEKQELNAPSFLRYANILSSLTVKEMRILSVMVQYRDYKPPDDGGFVKTKIDERHEALLSVTSQAEGHMQALMRTGLVNMVTDRIDYNLATTNNYCLTKIMDEILVYIQIIN